MATNKEAKVKFTAETSEFSKGIANINKSLGNLKSDLKLVNTEIKANGENFENLGTKQKTLKNIVDDLSDKLELQGNKLEAAKRLFGDNSDEVNKLYRGYNNIQSELVKFTRELKDTEKALDKMGDEAKETAQDVDKLDDEMDDMEGSTGGLKGMLEKLSSSFDMGSTGAIALGTAIGNLASEAISMAIEAIKEFAQYLWDLPEATREFESNMAKLAGSTKQYGYDTEDTNKKVKELYGYFEDEQVAVNAITNLQGMGLSQAELSKTTDAAISVWTAYGDSIPIESLTESINETSQVGKVTGVLADALNWAGISEEKFNEKLAKCKTTQERAKLVTDTLNGAYSESKDVYDEATESSRKLSEAQFDLKTKEDQLSDVIEPLKTKFQEFKNQALEKIIPVVEKVVDWFGKFAKWIKDLWGEIEKLKDTELGTFLDTIVKFIGLAVWATFKTTIEGIKTAVEVLVEVFKILADILEPVFEVINEFIDEAKPIFEDFVKGIEDGLKGVEKVIGPTKEAFDGIKDAIKDLFKIISDSLGFSELSDDFSSIKEIAKPLGEILGGIVLNSIKQVSAAFVIASGVIQGLIAVAKPLIQLIAGDFEGALKSFKEVPGKMTDIYDQTMSTLTDLELDAVGSVSNTAEGMDKEFNGIKAKSPGVDNYSKNVKKSMDDSSTETSKGLGSISGLLSAFNPSWKISKPNTTDATSANTGMLGILGKALTGWKPSWKVSKPSTTDATNTNSNMLNTLKGKLTGWKPSWKVSKPSTTDATNTNTTMLNTLKSKLTGWRPSWKISKPSTTDATNTNTTMLNNLKSKLTSWRPSWKVSKPNTSGATNENTSMLNKLKSKLYSFNPSWKISKPSTSNASDLNSMFSNIRRKLSSFRPSWSIPKPKLPTFSARIKWTSTTVLGKSFKYPSGISWNKLGGIFTSPTIFATPNAGLQGVGEAGAEAILPLDSFYAHLDSKIEEVANNDSTIQLNRIYGLLSQMELRLDIDGREFTRTAVAPNSREIDSYNNLRTSRR